MQKFYFNAVMQRALVLCRKNYACRQGRTVRGVKVGALAPPLKFSSFLSIKTSIFRVLSKNNIESYNSLTVKPDFYPHCSPFEYLIDALLVKRSFTSCKGRAGGGVV